MVVTSPPGRRRAQLQLEHIEYANKSHTPRCTSVDDISFFILRSFSASRSNVTKYTAWHDVVSTKSEIQRLTVTRAPRLFIKQMQAKNIKFPAIKFNTKYIGSFKRRQRQLNHCFCFRCTAAARFDHDVFYYISHMWEMRKKSVSSLRNKLYTPTIRWTATPLCQFQC